MPMEEKVVGMETTFDVVWRCLHDESSGIIGLYGMGGVGKTTLLKKINNELCKRNDRGFNLVVWMVASKQATVRTIQEDILRKLNVPTQSWTDKNEQERAILIYSILQKRKFILMLDDLWESLDLVEVRIPPLRCQTIQKLIFTTRSEEVCAQMRALKIKVRCLGEDEAWSLFQDKIEEETLNSHPQIPDLARRVAMECDGLPLALITVGRAMASKKTLNEWQVAIQVLQSYPSMFVGMADRVLPVLKFSYDSLPDETIKTCFVYCSLFPEDHEIIHHDLVDLWIGERLLEGVGGIHDARIHGMSIIGKLKLTCLLEEGQSNGRVKMHDVIRDMALWIACECGLKKKRFLVQEHFTLEKHGSVAEWQDAERVSLWGKDVSKVLPSACCPSLATCLIRGTRLTRFPSQFFGFLASIQVLDLSENKLLNELPNSIDSLKTLQYLNLSNTQLKTLPQGLKNLTGLRFLLLDFMTCLKDIPVDIISNMPDLQVFRMNFGSYRGIEALMDSLETKEHINEIGIYLPSYESCGKLMTYEKLQECLRNLRIESCDRSSIELNSSEYLESLHIYSMPDLRDIKFNHLENLQCVIIYRCSQLTDLNFLPCFCSHHSKYLGYLL